MVATRQASVASEQRFTKNRPCPICGGYSSLRRGAGQRCHGFLSGDGGFAHCSREERAGELTQEAGGTYAHRLTGYCLCGTQHGKPSLTSVAHGNGESSKVVVATYDYHDADGALLMQVVRYEPKYFRQKRPEGKGGWVWDIKGIKPVLYGLPELLAADPNEPVLLVEGEKDAKRARKLGLVATTTAMGAGKAHLTDLSPLHGRHVVVIPDQDIPNKQHPRGIGQAHADDLVRLLNGKAASVKRLDLPGPANKDLSDWLDGGHDVAELRCLIAEAAPAADGGDEATMSRLKAGGTWILTAPKQVTSIWGTESQVLWSDGEPLILYGPTGVGKSSVGQQICLGRIGVKPPELLGFALAPSERTLYLALDRPNQIRRSFARMVGECDEKRLNERLVIWDGPLPFDLGYDAEGGTKLVAMCRDVGADTVVIDSLKDAALELEKPAAGSLVNRAIQHVIAAGVNVLMIHHPRKAQIGNKKPKSIDDVFGSTWLAAGSGSVVLLWGEAGDALVTLEHLKQPLEIVGPLKIAHDHETGTTTLQQTVDLLDVVRSRNGITAQAAAAAMLEKVKPSQNEVDRFRKQLERLVGKGLACEQPGRRGGKGGGTPTVYYAQSQRYSDGHSNGQTIFHGDDGQNGERWTGRQLSDSESNGHERWTPDGRDGQTTDGQRPSLLREGASRPSLIPSQAPVTASLLPDPADARLCAACGEPVFGADLCAICEEEHRA